MVVQRGQIAEAERLEFEQIVRSCGREPGEFHTEVFAVAGAATMRRVHVASGRCAAQYEAGEGHAWTRTFAEHLTGGRFR
jgi:hypothetical protein